jgi:CBS domain-containing protein
MKDTSVREIMSRNVITVQEYDRLSKIEDLWKSNPIHHLVVLNAGKVVGIVSKIDMLKAYNGLSVGMGNNVLSSVSVGQVMTRNPLSVEPEDTIGLVADIMLANKFHSIPVIEDGELAGIVTSHDLIKYGFQ